MPVSEAMIQAAWRREQEPVAQLVTIRSDADPTPIRASDWPGGVVSNGVTFDYYPFELGWAGASQDQPFGQGKLTIANVDRRIEEAADAALTAPEIDLQLVRIAAPDAVEQAIIGATAPSIEGDRQRVSATIQPRRFDDEPACAWSYTPQTTPGLF